MYTLLKAVQTVKHFDATPLRIKAFENIARKRILIRIAYLSFRNTSHTPVGALLLMLYGLKCYMTIKLPPHTCTDLLCFASYQNEKTAITNFKSHLEKTSTFDLNISIKYLFDPLNWLASFHLFILTPRLYRLARRYCKNYHFMPACRVYSTIAYYLKYRYLLPQSRIKGILIANHYSPECTALAAAAHKDLLKVIFTNHAHIPKKTPYSPPVMADLSILTSQAAWQMYKRQSRQPFNHKLVGYEQKQSSIRLDFSTKKLYIGIFLTGLTNKNYVKTLIERIENNLLIDAILIRPHPVTVDNENLSDILQNFSFVRLSNGKLLSEDIDKCDLALCGNSSAAIEILKGGCPVLYDAELDRAPYDYNGFVQEGLILPVEKMDEHLLTRITAFYQRPKWDKIMQYYDASYHNDRKKLLREAENEIKRALDE